ncbi:MAG: radical SAM protein [Desulfobacteraceae bacterium]|nr:radical SAM protein [Desulfobacteraceae bacterium]
MIGVSVLNANRWGGIDIAGIAKKLNPNVKVVFGGVAASFLWKHFLTHFKEIDAVVIGEGEYSFLNLIKAIENKEKFDAIAGIAFRNGKDIVKTQDADLIRNLDDLPVPANYFTYQHLSLTRGCAGRCTFCGSPEFWRGKVRFHSPEYFINQIEILYQKGVNFFYISDDTFTMREDYVIEICRKIIEKNIRISWFAISKVSYISEEMLCWMRKAGCIQISYGVESGSQKIRELLNKNISEEQILRAFSLTTRYGILARAYFIYGCPGETEDTIRETIDLIMKIKPLSVIFYILDIFPGTAICDAFMRKYNLTDDIWLNRIEDILYFEKDPDLPKEKVLAFGKQLRESYYAHLSEFADNIELSDNKELYPFHADFLSRLGMTFSHGDYAKIEAVSDKDQTAETLYTEALRYFPDHRAYLGLGMVYQKRRDFQKAQQILSEGIGHYPQSESLNLCMGITLMNRGDFQQKHWNIF